MGPARRLGGLACVLAACCLLGCGGLPGTAPARARVEPSGRSDDLPPGLRTRGLRAPDDPTVAGARLVPQRLDEIRVWGAEPGGGDRAIVAGVRVIARPDRTLVAATERLPGAPSSVVEVPDRLGGGFLFAAGTRLSGAATWLGATRTVSVASAPIERVLVGLDRVYLRFVGGSLAALDPRSGAPLGLGPWPATPRLASLAALDGWRALALADLRGALITEDAGNSWRSLPLPMEPSDVLAQGDTFLVCGRDGERRVQGWRIRRDLETEPAFEGCTHGAPPAQSQGAEADRGNPFGTVALVGAVEDGWPLRDGTALVARDGALGRVRLSDGAVVEVAKDAFPMNPARCHAFSLASTRDRGAFGFTCGEAHGQTRVYAWAAEISGLAELGRFADPRQVNAFGNGALAVRGPCDAFAKPVADGGGETWCAMSPDGRWRQQVAASPGVRLVVLSDGRTALLTPPRQGDLSTSEVRVIDGSRTTSHAVSLLDVPSDASRALRLGVWMDGFEERRPGWLGGWVDLAGSIVGIEVALDGHVRLGEYIRDAGAPVVGGRWGFGWAGSRRGFETTDGGMTWVKGISLPDALTELPGGHERVCGPIGCLAAGWIRVGWGAEPTPVPLEPPPLRSPKVQSAWPLRLRCEPVGKSLLGVASQDARAGGGRPATGVGSRNASPSPNRSPQLDVAGAASDQVEISVEASGGWDGFPRSVPLARASASGPREGDWGKVSQWEVRWIWPWTPLPEPRASVATPAPWPNSDAARAAMDSAWAALRSAQGAPNRWTVYGGDDPDHALLVMRRVTAPADTQVLALEAGRAPVWVRPPANSFDPIDAATRLGGRWFVGASQRSHGPADEVLWVIEGATAREFARLPRLGLDPQPRVHLGRRSDGRALGVAVEGQPDVNTPASMWIVGVDADNAETSDPIRLLPLDAGERGTFACGGDAVGWELDVPYPASVEVQIGERWAATLAGVTAHLRLSPDQVCVEGLVGSTDREAAHASDALSRPLSRGSAPGLSLISPHEHAIPVTVYSARTHFHLRCALQ